MRKENLNPDEKRIIYNAVRYYQMYKTSLNGKDYKICDDILTRWFDDVYTQQKEQPT